MSTINTISSEGVGTGMYCKNYNCPKNKKLKTPINFKFSSIATPFEGDACKGECSAPPSFKGFYEQIGDFVYEGSECLRTDGPITLKQYGCDRADCVHNEKTICTRPEILIDKLNDRWVCKCFAFRKIRGHTDWSALLQGGNAKGGHVDDAYAQKINKFAKTTRSYRTHMKQQT